MAMVKCKECGQGVSSQAATCPHCGVSAPSLRPPKAKKKSSPGEALLGFVGLGIIVALVAHGCSSSDSSNNAASPATAQQKDTATDPSLPKHITKDTYGCKDRGVFEKTVQISVEHDKEAFTDLLSESLNNGECVMIPAGSEVYLSDVAMLSGVVQIRLKGTTDEYWTFTDYMK